MNNRVSFSLRGNGQPPFFSEESCPCLPRFPPSPHPACQAAAPSYHPRRSRPSKRFGIVIFISSLRSSLTVTHPTAVVLPLISLNHRPLSCELFFPCTSFHPSLSLSALSLSCPRVASLSRGRGCPKVHGTSLVHYLPFIPYPITGSHRP